MLVKSYSLGHCKNIFTFSKLQRNFVDVIKKKTCILKIGKKKKVYFEEIICNHYDFTDKIC